MSYEDLEFNSVDFANDWDLNEIDAQSLSLFKARLDDREIETLTYLVKKAGFDILDLSQLELGVEFLKKSGVIAADGNTEQYICLMHRSVTQIEYVDCVNSIAMFLQ